MHKYFNPISSATWPTSMTNVFMAVEFEMSLKRENESSKTFPNIQETNPKDMQASQTYKWNATQ